MDPHNEDFLNADPHIKEFAIVDPHNKDLFIVNPHNKNFCIVDPQNKDSVVVDPHNTDSVVVWIHNEHGPRTKAEIKVLSKSSQSLVHSGPAEPDLSTSRAHAPRQRSKYFPKAVGCFDLCPHARAVLLLRSGLAGTL